MIPIVDVLRLMLEFGMFIVVFIGLVITIVKLYHKK